MGFLLDDPNATPVVEDTNKLSNPGQPPTLGAGGSGSLFGAGPPGVAEGASPQSPAKSNQSGAWANLNSYLSANQDQAGKMGQDVAGSVSNEAQGAQKSLNNDTAAYGTQVDNATVKGDTDLFNAVANSAGGDSGSQNASTSASSSKPESPQTVDYSDVLNNTGLRDEFVKDVNASYSAPFAFTASGDTQKAYTDAQGDIQNSGSASGQQTLLNKQYQNASVGGYNQGEKNLDQLLMGGSAQSQQAFGDLRKNYSDIDSDISNAALQAGIYSQQGAQTTKETATQAQAALNNAAGGFKKAWTPGMDQAVAHQSAELDYMKALLSPNTSDAKSFDASILSDKDKADMQASVRGIQGTNLYGGDASQFIHPGDTGATFGNTMTADEQKQLVALNSFAGGNANVLNGNLGSLNNLAGGYNAPDAGKFNPYSVDNMDAVHAAAGQRQTDFESALEAYVNHASDSAKQVAGKNSGLFSGGLANILSQAMNDPNFSMTPAQVAAYLGEGSSGRGPTYDMSGVKNNITNAVAAAKAYQEVKGQNGSAADALAQLSPMGASADTDFMKILRDYGYTGPGENRQGPGSPDAPNLPGPGSGSDPSQAAPAITLPTTPSGQPLTTPNPLGPGDVSSSGGGPVAPVAPAAPTPPVNYGMTPTSNPVVDPAGHFANPDGSVYKPGSNPNAKPGDGMPLGTVWVPSVAPKFPGIGRAVRR